MRVAVDILVQGLLLGGLYALFALGQSLMFGVMRLTNTAQGDFIVLGAFGSQEVRFYRFYGGEAFVEHSCPLFANPWGRDCFTHPGSGDQLVW